MKHNKNPSPCTSHKNQINITKFCLHQFAAQVQPSLTDLWHTHQNIVDPQFAAHKILPWFGHFCLPSYPAPRPCSWQSPPQCHSTGWGCWAGTWWHVPHHGPRKRNQEVIGLGCKVARFLLSILRCFSVQTFPPRTPWQEGQRWQLAPSCCHQYCLLVDLPLMLGQMFLIMSRLT